MESETFTIVRLITAEMVSAPLARDICSINAASNAAGRCALSRIFMSALSVTCATESRDRSRLWMRLPASV